MRSAETELSKQKRTKLGLELEDSARQILAHITGEKVLAVRRVALPDEIDVRRIRQASGMSQAHFARTFHIELRTLQDWEQGRRKPDATTRAYLAVIQRNPNAVMEALNP